MNVAHSAYVTGIQYVQYEGGERSPRCDGRCGVSVGGCAGVRGHRPCSTGLTR